LSRAVLCIINRKEAVSADFFGSKTTKYVNGNIK